MATIPTLPLGVSDYVAAFDLTSIAVTRDGRLVVTCKPAGAAATWLCPAKEASGHPSIGSLTSIWLETAGKAKPIIREAVTSSFMICNFKHGRSDRCNSS
jgi:hypothetical protein